MLASIPATLFLEWRAYDELEPFGELRQDYRIASVVQALYNLQRDPKKHRDPFPIADFVLKFGEPEGASREKRQTWQEQKLLAKILVGLHNAA